MATPRAGRTVCSGQVESALRCSGGEGGKLLGCSVHRRRARRSLNQTEYCSDIAVMGQRAPVLRAR